MNKPVNHRTLMWIYEQPNWPQFYWDKTHVLNLVSDARHAQGALMGRMSSIGFELANQARLETLTEDVLKSSRIEGLELDRDSVRSSIARNLGMEFAGIVKRDRNADGIVQIMLDTNVNSTKPIDEQRLFAWHAELFPTGRSSLQKITVGQWRRDEGGPMQVISGRYGNQTIHFQTPEASRVASEMSVFLTWLNDDDTGDYLLKSAIAHLRFLTIHPFDDGNGRIARAISDALLCRSDGTDRRFYSLSGQIEQERSDYYDELERQQRGSLDITRWLSWYLGCVKRAVATASQTLEHVFKKDGFWRQLAPMSLNERQIKVLTMMVEPNFKGFMNTSKYANKCKCSKDTALRDIQSLLKLNVFKTNESGGRSTSYRINEHLWPITNSQNNQ